MGEADIGCQEILDLEKQVSDALESFCAINNITDMVKEPQSRWNAALIYINSHVFFDKNKLKLQNNISKDNTKCIMNSTFGMYDFKKLDCILYIYYYMCSMYDKECSIMGYSLLTGINYDTLIDWGANERKLSTKGFGIVKKLRSFREESLSNKLATGNKNPVGILAILNRYYSWNLPGVTRESSTRAIMTAADLPRLDTTYTQKAILSDNLAGNSQEINETISNNSEMP